MPFTPDAEQVTADCDRGVLTIKLPKAIEQDKSRRISIGGAGAKTVVGSGAGQGAAIGKDWMRESGSQDGELDEQQAEQGQGAPA